MLEEVLGQPEGILYLRKVLDGTFTLPLLFVGEQGTGRRLSVMEAAKTVFEQSQHYALERGHHPDFRLVQVEDDKDIKVDSIRTMIDETHGLPSWAPWKFFVIDGADRLTIAAANALLKVLEEPPTKVRFFLIAECLEDVIPTIRSRCAVVLFRRLSEKLLVSKLEQYTEDSTKALVCARIAEGSLGRAMRCLVSGQLTLRDEMVVVLHLASNKDLFALFSAVNEVTDLSLGLCFLGQLLRDLLLLGVAPDKVINLDIADTLKKLSGQLNPPLVHRLLAELRCIRERSRAPINLAFHVKSALASVLS